MADFAKRSSRGHTLLSQSLIVVGLASLSFACIRNIGDDDGSGHHQGTPFEMAGISHDVGVSVEEEILFAGANYSPDPDYDGRVDVYNTRTGSWRVDQLPIAGTDWKAVTIGSRAYITSGQIAVPAGVPPNDISVTDTIQIYDGVTHQWSLESLSVPRIEAGVAAVGTKLIVAGGYDWNALPSYLDSIEIIDTATGQRSTAKLSVRRAPSGIAVIGTKAYIPGGRTSGSGATSDVMDILDVSTGGVTSVTMPHRRVCGSAAAAGGKVLVGGGWEVDFLDGFSTSLDIYDPSQGTWTTVTVPAHGSGLTIEVIGSYVALIGGQNIPGAVTLINSATNAVYDGGELTYRRYNHGSAVSGNRIYVGGGIGRTVPTIEGPLQTVEVIDMAMREISTLLAPE